jgi:hypothetical protein
MLPPAECGLADSEGVANLFLAKAEAGKTLDLSEVNLDRFASSHY